MTPEWGGGGGVVCPVRHLDQLKGETLVKDAVDLCSSGQLHRVHLVSRALDSLLKVYRELLHHP